jgi:AraC-like DNA-binding protein
MRDDFDQAYHHFDYSLVRLPVTPVSISKCAVRWSAGDKFERKRSAVFVLEMVVEGNMSIVQNGHEFVAGAGDLFVLHKNRDHFYAAGPAGFFKKWWVILGGAALDAILISLGLYEIEHIRPANPDAIERFFYEMASLFKTKKNGWQRKVSEKALLLLVELGEYVRPAMPPGIETALKFMQQNIHRSISNAELAALTGFTTQHFSRLFKSYMNSSPLQYHMQRRLSYARYLIESTPKPIKEIAATVGFDDQLHFSVVFKRHTGKPPSRWRIRYGSQNRHGK